jgi:hypothetical protein
MSDSLSAADMERLEQLLAEQAAEARKEALFSLDSLAAFLIARGLDWLWNRIAKLGRKAWEYLKGLFG